jgi:hypothetical protein
MAIILFGVASLHHNSTNWSLEFSFDVNFLFNQLLIFLEGFLSPSTSMTFHYPSILCLSSFIFLCFFVGYCVHYVHCAL